MSEEHPVNHICDVRFDRLDSEQMAIQTTVEAHSEAIRDNTGLLVDHGRRLTALETELRRQGELLLASQKSITEIATVMASVKESMDRMNGNMMRILYITIAALIVLAGVTKFSDLGVF